MSLKCIVTKAGDSSAGTTVRSCRDQTEFVLPTSGYEVGKWLIVDGGRIRNAEPVCPTSVVTIKGIPGKHVIVTVPAVKPPSFEAAFGISAPTHNFVSPLLGPIDALVDIDRYPENVLLELDVLKKSSQMKHALQKMSGHSAEWMARSQDVKLVSREAVLNSMEHLYAEGIVVKSSGDNHIVASEQPDGTTRLLVTNDDRLSLGQRLSFIGMDFCESVGMAVASEPLRGGLNPTDVANEFRVPIGSVTKSSADKIRVQRLGWVADPDRVVPQDRNAVNSVLLRLEMRLKPLAMHLTVTDIVLKNKMGGILEPEEHTLTAKLSHTKGDMTFFHCPEVAAPWNVFSARTDRLPVGLEATSGLWYTMTLQFYTARMPGPGRPAIVLSAIRVKEPAKPIAIKPASDESRVPSHKAPSNRLAYTNTTSGVGVICYKDVDGCYVYSHKVSRAALVIRPPRDVNVGDWLLVGFATDNNAVSIAEVRGRADAVFQTTPLHRSVLVHCRVSVGARTTSGSIVCSSNFAPSVFDPRGLSAQFPAGTYNAFVKYVYDKDATSGHWQLEYLVRHRIAFG